jgi:hypothetical protein
LSALDYVTKYETGTPCLHDRDLEREIREIREAKRSETVWGMADYPSPRASCLVSPRPHDPARSSKREAATNVFLCLKERNEWRGKEEAWNAGGMMHIFFLLQTCVVVEGVGGGGSTYIQLDTTMHTHSN